MSDRMTDERLALLESENDSIRTREFVAALRWERARVVRLEAALTAVIYVQGTSRSSGSRLVDAIDWAQAVLAEGATT